MDWIRLGNSGVDLTGVGGVPQIITLCELANHNKRNDAWIAIRGLFSFALYTIIRSILLLRKKMFPLLIIIHMTYQ